MRMTGDTQLSNVRVVNFSNKRLPFKNILTFDGEHSDDIVALVRTHADLPYVYVISQGKEALAREVLLKLKAIRSTCYPHALFVEDESDFDGNIPELDIEMVNGLTPDDVAAQIIQYSQKRFTFDHSQLKIENSVSLPVKVDVVVVGAGITGLYAADRLKEKNLSFCVIEKRDVIGGIWSQYANTVSQVNSSEGAYRLIEPTTRSNRDHSTTREILEDMVHVAQDISEHIHLNTEVVWVEKKGPSYQTDVSQNGQTVTIESTGIILAINDRVGEPRAIEWKNQEHFKGDIVAGFSDENKDLDWRNKKVVVVGMGAFAIENARTALEGGAEHVTVICRRHGTVCPKIIDYLNFATPYDDQFQHEKKSNMRNMMFWKKLYTLSGATQPECWMAQIKHTGHTISVSDIWFIGHYLKKLNTTIGDITEITANGVVVNDKERIDADIIVHCVGFHRNAINVKNLCRYEQMYNNNYIDKDLMYLADAFIDDDVFNSFFGSSVLEMAKFYMDVYLEFFNNSGFGAMMETRGIEKISIDKRSWSHYIAGADALMQQYPSIREAANKQVDHRSKNFLEAHDLEAYITENKREWLDTHTLLAGRTMKEEECLPYLFEKLLDPVSK